MIQFDKSKASNENAFWADSSSFPNATVAFVLTSSYSGQSQVVYGTRINKYLTDYGGWVITRVPGASVPSVSGLYEAKIYRVSVGDQATWGNYTFTFGESKDTFGDAAITQIVGDVVSEDLVFISGSDYDPVVDYNYEDQAIFTVYNG